jgi:hypothetical protein
MTKRYTDEDISLAFEDIHSGNLVIGMYVDDLKKENSTYKKALENLLREHNLSHNFPHRVELIFAVNQAQDLLYGKINQ